MKKELRILKNEAVEQAMIHRRLLFSILFVLVFFSLIAWRFFHLQIIQYETYQTQSQANRVHMQRLAPPRGLIMDRQQRIVADNRPSYQLAVYRDQIADMGGLFEQLMELELVSERQINTFLQRAVRYRPFEAVPIRFNLNDEEIARFAARKMLLPGVEIQANLMRYYPQRDLFAHMIGYVGRIDTRDLRQIDPDNYGATNHIGRIGVERSYEEKLHGRVGYAHVETNVRGQVLRTLESTPPVPGKNLVLHADLDLQQAAVTALGHHRGAIVALDASNGGVLVAASTPSFDANLFVQGISFVDYDSLRDDIDLPLFNRVLQGRYPPGSTVKPLVGLAGLEQNKVTRRDAMHCPGWYELPYDDRVYRDWRRQGHGHGIDFISAMEQSCDVYYYDLSYKLGVIHIHHYFDLFGLGKRTEIDVPSESPGVNPSPQWKRNTGRGPWVPGDTLNIGIGQGFLLVTPLQLAYATSIIANQGRVLVPQMVAQVAGEPVATRELEPVVLKNEQNWQHVTDSMVQAVHGSRATARGISRGLTYTMAGKTGTAQVIGIPQGEEYDRDEVEVRQRDHALFVAFAPADAPEIVVAVVVENGEHGSTVAAPMARKVMDLWFEKQQNRGGN